MNDYFVFYFPNVSFFLKWGCNNSCNDCNLLKKNLEIDLIMTFFHCVCVFVTINDLFSLLFWAYPVFYVFLRRWQPASRSALPANFLFC